MPSPQPRRNQGIWHSAETAKTNGWSKLESDLFNCRLKMSLVALISASDFAQVNTPCKDKPCENLCVIFDCSESYQVLPNGAPAGLNPELNCGNGSRDCRTVA